MNSLIETCARAVCKVDDPDGECACADDDEGCCAIWHTFVTTTLKAIAEHGPTEAMVEAGSMALSDAGVGDIEPTDAPECFTTMIQTATEGE